MTVYTFSPQYVPVYKLMIDWDNNGYQNAYSDCSVYLKSYSVSRGHSSEMNLIADAGTCQLVLDNTSKLFSLLNSGGALYNKFNTGVTFSLLVQAPGGLLQNAATNGTPTAMFQSNVWYPLFYGKTLDYSNEGGTSVINNLTIDCYDFLGYLQKVYITLPYLQTVYTTDVISDIINAAYNAPGFSAAVAFTGNPTNNQTITFTCQQMTGSNVAEIITYTFKTTLTGSANEVFIGSSLNNSLLNAITGMLGTDTWTDFNGNITTGYAAGTNYATNMTRSNFFKPDNHCYLAPEEAFQLNYSLLDSASYLSPILTSTDVNNVLCLNSSMLGVGFFLSISTTTSATIYLPYISSSTHLPSASLGNQASVWLHNGTSAIYTLLFRYVNDDVANWAVGQNTMANNFAYVGDTIKLDKSQHTTGFDFAKQVIESEYGRLVQKATGQIWCYSFTDLEYAYNQVVSTSLSALGNTWNLQNMPYIKLSIKHDKKMNEANVTYIPRSLSAANTVLFSTNSSFQVPGQSGTQRWNGTVALPGGGSVTKKFSYIDPVSQQPMGAQSVNTTLVAGTDWTAVADDGIVYTFFVPGPLTFSVVNRGSYAEVTIKNTALGPINITYLQLRGVGIYNFQSNTITKQSPGVIGNNVNTFSYQHNIKMPVLANFADSLSNWLLAKYSPQIPGLFEKINFQSTTYLGDIINAPVIPFAIDLYDQVTLIDPVTGLTASAKFISIGESFSMTDKSTPSFSLQLERIDAFHFFQTDTDLMDGTSVLGL